MTRIFYSLLALFLIFEEWLWDLLTGLGRLLSKLLHLERFENWLTQVSPPVALLAIGVPLLIVTPINIAAIWLLTQGMVVQGLGVEVLAKLLGTLMVARVFNLTKPQLLSYKAIHWVYSSITHWLAWAHERIVETAIYQLSKRLKAQIKEKIRAWRERHPA